MIKFINSLFIGQNAIVSVEDNITYDIRIKKGDFVVQLTLAEALALRVYINRIEKLVSEEHE